MFNTKRRSFVAGIAMLLSSGVAFSGSHSACGDVSITEMDWASAAVITAVSKFLMENGLGCKVTVVPSSTVPAAASVAETGKPDIVTEMWVNSSSVYQELEAAGKVQTIAPVYAEGGAENWWIPEYLATKHPELKTLKGIMENPSLVGGRFNNCPVGWGCRIANDNLIKATGLRNAMEIFDHGSGETLATSIAAAYADKAPWFGYYWGPTAILGKYPMVAVDMGAPLNADIHACNQKPDCANPRVSPYPAAPVVTGATADFLKREPKAAALMSKVKFTTQELSTVLAWKQDNNASADEAAVYFLTNYKNVWSNWLDEGSRAKLSKIL